MAVLQEKLSFISLTNSDIFKILDEYGDGYTHNGCGGFTFGPLPLQ